MRKLVKQGSQLLLMVFVLSTVWSNVQAQQLPPVLNVQIDGDQLTWDAVDGATGYNIYSQGNYRSTIKGERRYTATETGFYAVAAFDDQGNFSPLRGSNSVFFEGGVDNRPRLVDVGDGIVYITQRCFDVDAGESCVARCPDFVGGLVGVSEGYFVGSATGGSCSSSDTININSLISSEEYACSVSIFTSRVESKVACLITE